MTLFGYDDELRNTASSISLKSLVSIAAGRLAPEHMGECYVRFTVN